MIESSDTQTGQNEQQNGQKAAAAPEAHTKEAHANGQDVEKRIQELEAQIKDKDAQIKDKEAKYLYLYAEFENFKKRTVKERSDLLKFGWESLAHELLQTLDNLERALQHIPPSTDKSLVEGLNMVLNQFKSTLQKQGVQYIESVQKDFDPNLHEAVAQEESDMPSGMILKEHSRGYTLHGRLLRPARVVVSGGQAQSKSG